MFCVKISGEINPMFLKLKFLVHCVVGIVMEVPSGINLMMVKWVSVRWKMKKKWKRSVLVETTWVRWVAFLLSLHACCVYNNHIFKFCWDRSCHESSFQVFDHMLKRMSYRRQKRWWNAYMLFYTRLDVEENALMKSLNEVSLCKFC